MAGIGCELANQGRKVTFQTPANNGTIKGYEGICDGYIVRFRVGGDAESVDYLKSGASNAGGGLRLNRVGSGLHLELGLATNRTDGLPDSNADSPAGGSIGHTSPVTVWSEGNVVKAVFDREFLQETERNNEFPTEGEMGLVLSPQVLNVLGAKVGIGWMGNRGTKVVGVVKLVFWSEGSLIYTANLAPFEGLVLGSGGVMERFVGSYGVLDWGVDQGGKRYFDKDLIKGFVGGKVMEGSERETFRFDVFMLKEQAYSTPAGVVRSSPVDVGNDSDFLDIKVYKVKGKGGVCVVGAHVEKGVWERECQRAFAEIYRELADLRRPSKAEATIIQDGRDYTDRVNVVDKPGDVYRVQVWEKEWIERNADRWRIARENLEGVRKVCKEHEGIDISPSIRSKYEEASKLLSLSAAAFSQGRYSKAHLLSSEALLLSKEVYYDPTMVAELYFPDEHIYAVLLPFWAPLAVPLILGLLKEIVRFKKLKAKAKEKVKEKEKEKEE